MLKTLKKLKTETKVSDIDEHLLYVFKNTTPRERLVWLKKAFEFWKILNYNKPNKIHGKLTK